MTRTNYQKFLLLAKNELNDNLFLQTVFSDPESPQYFTKIRRNNTKFIQYSVKKLNYHQGVFIDIFPFDKTPDDQLLRKVHSIKIRIYSYLFVMSSNLDFYQGFNNYMDIVKFILIRLIHYILKPIPRTVLYTLLDKERRRYNNKHTKSNILLPMFRGKYTHTKHLFPVKKIQFEDIQVNGPNNCDAYLSGLYGDYMTPPPPHKRPGHSPVVLEINVD
jgi:lipopolysaccharide cholinephosphotransferase